MLDWQPRRKLSEQTDIATIVDTIAASNLISHRRNNIITIADKLFDLSLYFEKLIHLRELEVFLLVDVSLSYK